MLLALTGAMTISCLAKTSQLIVKALSPYAGESWYDELEVVEEKREYAHSNFILYHDIGVGLDNEKSTLSKDPARSNYYASLNGKWAVSYTHLDVYKRQ